VSALVWVLVAAAVGIAVVDWVSVGAGNRRLEYVAKPATMVPLIVAAAVLDPVRPEEQWWFVAALVLSLVGDVFLMLEDQERWFVPGLASFLLGHVAYIVGMLSAPTSGTALVVGAVVVAVAAAVGGPIIVRGATRTDRRLLLPVAAYVTVISVMVVSAAGSTVVLAVIGAALFYASDFSIGMSRFVKDFPGSRLVIITTYHAAQVLLVLSLVTKGW
jgi:uncharacterized membrane protein YhhN